MSDAETPDTKSGNKKDREPLPDPPFKIEYASSGRSKCKVGCSTVIEKDALRLGTAKPFRGNWAYEFKHWGCITPEDIKVIYEHKSESGVKLLGMDDVRPEDQERAKKALKKGRVDEKDAQTQKAKSDIARVKEAEKEKEKEAKKKRQLEGADTDEEPKTKKKKTKNSEDSEKPKEPKEKKPKKKEEKERHAAPRTKEGKKPQKPAPTSSQPHDDDIVPDSEEEAEVPIEKHKAEEKKSPKKDKDRRLSKNKDSSMTSINWPPTPPRSDKEAKEKGKEKKEKSPKKQKSPKKKSANDEDDQMEIDEVSQLVTQASIDKLPDDKPKKPEKKTETLDSDSENEALASKKPTKKLEVTDKAKEHSKAKTATAMKSTAKPKIAPQEKKAKAKPAPRKSTSTATPIPEASTSTSVPPTPTHNSANPVFVDLSGIAPFLRSPHPQLPNPTRLPPPKVPLSEFCKKYELSDALREKLKGLNIDGPHVLRLIKDEALEKEGLSIGEVAGLRDAEERWMADHTT